MQNTHRAPCPAFGFLGCSPRCAALQPPCCPVGDLAGIKGGTAHDQALRGEQGIKHYFYLINRGLGHDTVVMARVAVGQRGARAELLWGDVWGRKAP